MNLLELLAGFKDASGKPVSIVEIINQAQADFRAFGEAATKLAQSVREMNARLDAIDIRLMRIELKIGTAYENWEEDSGIAEFILSGRTQAIPEIPKVTQLTQGKLLDG